MPTYVGTMQCKFHLGHRCFSI